MTWDVSDVSSAGPGLCTVTAYVQLNGSIWKMCFIHLVLVLILLYNYEQSLMFWASHHSLSSQVAALRTTAVQGGPTYNLSQQPWAQPGERFIRS